MIGNPPPDLPDREYFDYNGETVSTLPPGLLKRRNPFAQSSVSAVKEVLVCRRKAFLKAVVGLREPEHPTAAVGKIMHQQVEDWHKGVLIEETTDDEGAQVVARRGEVPGPFPTHPSIVAAIEAGLIPPPGPNVLSEEQFWVPTGIQTPDSPDGQLWLKGFMDLIVRDGKTVTLPDMKTKGHIQACTRYALTPEELTTDPQMGLYGHVFHSTEPNLHLTVGHIYLVRDPSIPYARWVPVTLTAETARRSYLKLLAGAEQMITDARCGDWQAVPGNFAKCERPFKCPFIPLCHGKPAGEEIIDVANPYANDPVAITPPDAAPPGMSAGEPKLKEPKKPRASKTTKESTVTDENDFDAILNAAMGMVAAPPAPKPAALPTATMASMDAAIKNLAPAVTVPVTQQTKATPLPPGAEGAGDADVGALDAMLSSMPKGPGKAPAPAQAAAKPVTPAPATPQAQKPAQEAPAKPQTPPTPPPAVAAKIEQVKASLEPTPVTVTGPAKPIALLLVGCTTDDANVTMSADLIAHVDAVVVANHNKRPGVQPIASMYQLDHGMWRGDFCGILAATVRARAHKNGPMILCCVGDSPATSAAVETLTSLSTRRVWGVR